MIEWVEKGVAPKQIIASRWKNNQNPALCPYPQVAKYNYAGKPDALKASFAKIRR
ncbi:MAG: tannase/feruloyl esterase family alpha/beta hydrolase [Chloracidobacterium sp.]|nr:tannase/feruloyl esterase family alpha/beta hydrolase [Chloracidobacterium sp.]